MKIEVYETAEIPDLIVMLLKRDMSLLSACEDAETLPQSVLDLTEAYLDKNAALLLQEAYDRLESRKQFRSIISNAYEKLEECLEISNTEDYDSSVICAGYDNNDEFVPLAFCLVVVTDEVLLNYVYTYNAILTLVSYLLPELVYWEEIPMMIEKKITKIGRQNQNLSIHALPIDEDEKDMLVKFHNYTEVYYENYLIAKNESSVRGIDANDSIVVREI